VTEKPPLLQEPEVWVRKGTKRAFANAIKREHEGASDEELKALADVFIGKLSGDIIRVMLERRVLPLFLWVNYTETLARKFDQKEPDAQD
jgi:hypothetical protein